MVYAVVKRGGQYRGGWAARTGDLRAGPHRRTITRGYTRATGTRWGCAWDCAGCVPASAARAGAGCGNAQNARMAVDSYAPGVARRSRDGRLRGGLAEGGRERVGVSKGKGACVARESQRVGPC